jgi:hypothetical protein
MHVPGLRQARKRQCACGGGGGATRGPGALPCTSLTQEPTSTGRRRYLSAAHGPQHTLSVTHTQSSTAIALRPSSQTQTLPTDPQRGPQPRPALVNRLLRDLTPRELSMSVATVVARSAPVASTSGRIAPTALPLPRFARAAVPTGLSAQMPSRGRLLSVEAKKEERKVGRGRDCVNTLRGPWRAPGTRRNLNVTPGCEQGELGPMETPSDASPFFEPLLRGLVLGVGAGVLSEVLHVATKVRGGRGGQRANACRAGGHNPTRAAAAGGRRHRRRAALRAAEAAVPVGSRGRHVSGPSRSFAPGPPQPARRPPEAPCSPRLAHCGSGAAACRSSVDVSPAPIFCHPPRSSFWLVFYAIEATALFSILRENPDEKQAVRWRSASLPALAQLVPLASLPCCCPLCFVTDVPRLYAHPPLFPSRLSSQVKKYRSTITLPKRLMPLSLTSIKRSLHTLLHGRGPQVRARARRANSHPLPPPAFCYTAANSLPHSRHSPSRRGRACATRNARAAPSPRPHPPGRHPGAGRAAQRLPRRPRAARPARPRALRPGPRGQRRRRHRGAGASNLTHAGGSPLNEIRPQPAKQRERPVLPSAPPPSCQLPSCRRCLGYLSRPPLCACLPPPKAPEKPRPATPDRAPEAATKPAEVRGRSPAGLASQVSSYVSASPYSALLATQQPGQSGGQRGPANATCARGPSSPTPSFPHLSCTATSLHPLRRPSPRPSPPSPRPSAAARCRSSSGAPRASRPASWRLARRWRPKPPTPRCAERHAM